MRTLVSLLAAAALLLLATGRPARAQVSLTLELSRRIEVNRTKPTEQNNIVTLACRRSDTGRHTTTPRYFVRNPLTSREEELNSRYSTSADGSMTFTVTPELEGDFSCGDGTLPSSVRSQTLSLSGERSM